jgi:hypothetical protein
VGDGFGKLLKSASQEEIEEPVAALKRENKSAKQAF